MPRLKISILWSMGNPLPKPILRIDSNVQICLKIPTPSELYYIQMLRYQSCEGRTVNTIFKNSHGWYLTMQFVLSNVMHDNHLSAANFALSSLAHRLMRIYQGCRSGPFLAGSGSGSCKSEFLKPDLDPAPDPAF